MKLPEKMTDAYLVNRLVIEHPESKLPVTLAAKLPIKINHITGLAWIWSYQVKLKRHQYTIVN